VLPTLFFEFHGTERGVAEQVEQIGALAEEYGGSGFEWATRAEDRNRLWQARHDAYYAALALKSGTKGWATDVCVPISRLADCLLETRRDVEESGLVAPMVGHVGDGNFHLVFLVDSEDQEQMKRASQVNERMVVRAIDMGGTCTGEHGIGYGKIEFLKHEHGDGVSVMRAIKQSLDPQGIMNPGKIV
jgi:D-lactate dehydrogenase (cytochrome)